MFKVIKFSLEKRYFILCIISLALINSSFVIGNEIELKNCLEYSYKKTLAS